MDTYAIWLLPEPCLEQLTAPWIEQCATQFGAPRFRPHVTLIGRFQATSEAAVAALDRLGARLDPLVTMPTGVEVGESFYRSLYISLATPAALSAARQYALRVVGQADPGHYEPHLSLLYGTGRREERAEWAGRLMPELPRTFRLDRIQLVRVGPDICCWEPLSTIGLSHPAECAD